MEKLLFCIGIDDFKDQPPVECSGANPCIVHDARPFPGVCDLATKTRSIY